MRFKSLTICLVILVSTVAVFPQQSLREQIKASKSSTELAKIESQVLRFAISDPNDPERILTLGLLRLYQSRFRESSSLFRRVVSLGKNDAFTQMLFVESLLGERKAAEAKERFNAISNTNVVTPEDKVSYARLAFRVGECDKSYEIEKLISDETSKGKLLPTLLSCRLQSKKTDLTDLVARAKTVKSWNIRKESASVLFSATRYRSVIEVVGEENNKKQEPLEFLAKSFLLLGDLRRANEFATQLGSLFPNSPELDFINGVFALNQKEPQKAIDLLGKYISAFPDSTAALEQYVLATISANEPSKGLPQARRLVQLRPENEKSLYLHGAISLQANRLEESEISLTKLLKLYPNNSQGCLALGLVISADENRFEKARSQMRECIKRNPGNYEAYYRLGLSYKERGDNKEAINLIKQSVDLRPDNANAQRDLGILYVQIEDNDNALRHLKIAVGLNDEDSDTHFQLSRLYNLLGEKELAKTHFQRFRALRKKPSSGM